MIKHDLQDYIELGNIYAARDWGYAPEFMHYVWKMMQLNEPDDFVLATNEEHQVDEFLCKAFEYCGLEYQKYIRYNKSLERSCEVPYLKGDFTKAKKFLGFEPKVRFKEIIKIMCEHDLKKVKMKFKINGY